MTEKTQDSVIGSTDILTFHRRTEHIQNLNHRGIGFSKIGKRKSEWRTLFSLETVNFVRIQTGKKNRNRERIITRLIGAPGVASGALRELVNRHDRHYFSFYLAQCVKQNEIWR